MCHVDIMTICVMWTLGCLHTEHKIHLLLRDNLLLRNTVEQFFERSFALAVIESGAGA